jgi:hypothetical protein
MRSEIMRARILLIACLLPLLSGVAVFPPMVGGDFKFRVQPGTELDADGIPLSPPAQSIGIISSLEGTVIENGCVDVTSADPSIIYDILGKVKAVGQRDSLKAHAYAEPGCAGLMSAASENTAYAYPGMSPKEPDLLALLKRLIERI